MPALFFGWCGTCNSEAGHLEATSVQFNRIRMRLLFVPRPRFQGPSPLFVASASMAGLVLTPVAMLAAVFAAWRLGADPGWASPFFISSGLFSHYQLWFAAAIAAQASAFKLNRWVANRTDACRPLAPL